MTNIKISEVLECLNKGMSREEIAEHFGITMADCKRVFQHPTLKGKKMRKAGAFNLIDDLNPQVSNEEIANTPEPDNTSTEELLEQTTDVAEVEEEAVRSQWAN